MRHLVTVPIKMFIFMVAVVGISSLLMLDAENSELPNRVLLVAVGRLLLANSLQ